jgi:hypothetical protein
MSIHVRNVSRKQSDLIKGPDRSFNALLETTQITRGRAGTHLLQPFTGSGYGLSPRD